MLGIDRFHRLAERGDAFLVCFVAQFVADLPILDLIRARVSVGGPELAHRRGGRAVEVFHLIGGILGRLAGEPHADQRLGADPLAELEELFQPGVGRFQAAPAGRKRHALLRVADGGLPLEALDRAAAEANDARPQGLQRLGHVGPPAAHVLVGISET